MRFSLKENANHILKQKITKKTNEDHNQKNTMYGSFQKDGGKKQILQD